MENEEEEVVTVIIKKFYSDIFKIEFFILWYDKIWESFHI